MKSTHPAPQLDLILKPSSTPKPIPSPKTTTCEIQTKAEFRQIRYAQVWEDTDILLQGLNIQPSDDCLSIASAGDNTLALLSQNPRSVTALDMNPAQLHCLELRVAGYQTLQHPEYLQLFGARACPPALRLRLYQRCRKLLQPKTQQFWDALVPQLARHGFGGLGKFERYLRLFAQRVLPLIHSKQSLERLFTAKSPEARAEFFQRHWQNKRWRFFVRLFFSRTLIGKLGRDPAFFDYAQDSFAKHLEGKIRHAFVEQEPAQNPYLHWILRGHHGETLPFALREENFQPIADNLHKLEWHQLSLEEFFAQNKGKQRQFHKFNLSNLFEYMSEANYQKLLQQILQQSHPKARLLYWNMLVPRSRPESLSQELHPKEQQAQSLHQQDQAFFYQKLVIEETKGA